MENNLILSLILFAFGVIILISGEIFFKKFSPKSKVLFLVFGAFFVFWAILNSTHKRISEEIPGISIEGKNSELREQFFQWDSLMNENTQPFVYIFNDSSTQTIIFHWPENSTWYLNENENTWYSYQYFSRTFGEIYLNSEFTNKFYSFWKQGKFLEISPELVLNSGWHSVSLNNSVLIFSSNNLDRKLEGSSTMDYLIYSEKEVLEKFCEYLK